MTPELTAPLARQAWKRESTMTPELVKHQPQNNIKDDKGVVHRFMSLYETPEANSVFVLRLTNGS